MTPYESKMFLKEEAERQAELAANWHHPLSKGSNNLKTVLDGMKEFKLAQEDVPLIIKLTENPKYFTSKLFISIVSELNIQSEKKNTVDQEIREKVSELSNGKGSVIKYTKLS